MNIMKMMRLATSLLVAGYVLSLCLAVAVPVHAGQGNGVPSGPHFQINLIGHPKGISGDFSNGRAIMIPLITTPGDPLPCDFADGVTVTDDTEGTLEYYTMEPTKGAKLLFTPAEDFAIVDRDATDDNYAEIEVPIQDSDDARVFAVDVYVRILGKPNQCMRINGYVDDMDQSLWFWSGRVELKRKAGKSTFVKVNDLFDVWWCQVDDNLECEAGTSQELSVFDSSFANYFWDIENNGARNVQVRFYPITSLEPTN